MTVLYQGFIQASRVEICLKLFVSYGDVPQRKVGGGGEYTRFQLIEIIEEFYGFEIFDSKILGGGAVFAVVPAHPGRVVLRIKYKQTLF